MKKLPYLLILSGLISAPALAADAAPAAPNPFAGNIGVTTDYIFRGVTQSQHKPAVSGGLDYTHSSGLYAGTWLSNQSWVDAVPNGASSSQPWTLEKMATHCGMGITTFTKYSRDLVNNGPVEYLNQCRLNCAARQLRETPARPITEIAFANGFNSSQYFATTFQRRFHMAPRAFRAAT